MTTTIDEAAQAALNSAINAIGKHYYDVTIICTTDDHQASYWMDILENGLLLGKKVLAVSEDWDNSSGAGNGLGTLYAWQKACALAKVKYGTEYDMSTELQSGSISAALYHTAGKGTRLAPLPASENNNKPGVKLPFPMKCADGTIRPLSVLESVVRQTGIYERKGRLSVFWGDQVFVPTAPFDVKPTHHADILCTLLGDTPPTATEWHEQGLDKYGVIVVLQNGEAAQLEKVSHATAVQMLADLGTSIQQVGPSLGSFSVSAVFLQALLDTFASELVEKTGKLDTDPHFWMPLTLPESSYISLMRQKGTPEEESKQHYDRMQQMKGTFIEKNGTDMGLFGAVNVGKGACWWDYGQLKLYSANCFLLVQPNNQSAKLLKQFLGMENDGHIMNSKVTEEVSVDDKSYILSSNLGNGSVSQSLLANVSAQTIQCDGAILINCAAKSITAGKGAILYNIIATDENEEICIAPGDVVVGVTAEDSSSFRLRSRMDIDGGTAWKIKLNDGTAVNDLSFEQVHANNYHANIGEIARKRQELYNSLVQKLGL